VVADLFVTPERDVDKPFRLTVNDVYKDGGLAIGGKVETGFVTTGDKVRTQISFLFAGQHFYLTVATNVQLMLMPGQEICTVKTIRFNGQAVEVAAAGFNVDIVLQGVEQNAIAFVFFSSTYI
jgi:elongation factor 1 alpha-like protein